MVHEAVLLWIVMQGIEVAIVIVVIVKGVLPESLLPAGCDRDADVQGQIAVLLKLLPGFDNVALECVAVRIGDLGDDCGQRRGMDVLPEEIGRLRERQCFRVGDNRNVVEAGVRDEGCDLFAVVE